MLRAVIFISLLVLLSACGTRNYQQAAANQTLPQLVVRGEASVNATPDQLRLRIGVVSHHADADTAMTENNRQMSAVMEQLKELGLGETEMLTGQFRVRPQWSQPPRPAPANWQRKIAGYQISNELQIVTDKVNLAGQLLGMVQQAGANQIGGLQFTLADPTQYQHQAIDAATTNAMGKAQTMAESAGVSLGTLQSITLDSPSQMPQVRMLAEVQSSAERSVPVAAGQVAVAATVTMTYRLKEKVAEKAD